MLLPVLVDDVLDAAREARLVQVEPVAVLGLELDEVIHRAVALDAHTHHSPVVPSTGHQLGASVEDGDRVLLQIESVRLVDFGGRLLVGLQEPCRLTGNHFGDVVLLIVVVRSEAQRVHGHQRVLGHRSPLTIRLHPHLLGVEVFVLHIADVPLLHIAEPHLEPSALIHVLVIRRQLVIVRIVRVGRWLLSLVFFRAGRWLFSLLLPRASPFYFLLLLIGVFSFFGQRRRGCFLCWRLVVWKDWSQGACRRRLSWPLLRRRRRCFLVGGVNHMARRRLRFLVRRVDRNGGQRLPLVGRRHVSQKAS